MKSSFLDALDTFIGGEKMEAAEVDSTPHFQKFGRKGEENDKLVNSRAKKKAASLIEKKRSKCPIEIWTINTTGLERDSRG